MWFFHEDFLSHSLRTLNYRLIPQYESDENSSHKAAYSKETIKILNKEIRSSQGSGCFVTGS